MAEKNLEGQVSDPELRRAFTPGDVIGCKRVLVSSDYYATFERPNVELIPQAVIELTEDGVLAEDGTERKADLVVLATHGRDGVAHWLQGSVAEAVFRRSAIPTLFIAPGARGFVDQVSGDVQLKRVLVPVDFSPPPGRAIAAIHRFGRLLTGASVAVDLLHVGEVAPRLRVASSSALLPDSLAIAG